MIANVVVIAKARKNDPMAGGYCECREYVETFNNACGQDFECAILNPQT